MKKSSPAIILAACMVASLATVVSGAPAQRPGAQRPAAVQRPPAAQRPPVTVQRPAVTAPVRPPVNRDQREDIRDRREDVRDRREDVRDRREDVLDRREDVRDRREDVRDRREDVIDARRDGGRLDQLEDIRDRREDVADRREDVADRREDVRDRREDVRDRREDVRDRLEDQIERNPRLAARVRGLLPPNRNLRDVAPGFRNQGQFIAALNASKNLNIPFDQLKSRMTGPRDMSLGQAIHDLRPDLNERDWKNEEKKAEDQAKKIEEDTKS